MPTRDRILDAALAVMEERGLARATTKEIARVAGCSEPLLYRYFPDKQALFMEVLTERLPRLTDWASLAGQGEVRTTLATAVATLVAFYERSFPIAASLFGDTDVLAAHRERIAGRGGGPQGPALLLQRLLAAEQRLGRIGADVDVAPLARTLTGAALLEAFLAAYAGAPIADREAVAQRIVGTVALG